MAATNALFKSLKDRMQWVTYLHLRAPAWRQYEADALFQKYHDDASPYLVLSAQNAVGAALYEMGLSWDRTKNS